MDHPSVYPFPLANRTEPAEFVRGAYDDALEENQRYDIRDLVTTRSGKVARAVESAGDIGSLAVAGQPYDMGPMAGERHKWFRERGVPLNRILPYHDQWVFNLQGELTDEVMADINSGAERELAYDAEEDTLMITSGTTNPAVRLVQVFEGEVGDTNPLVVVEFLPDVVL